MTAKELRRILTVLDDDTIISISIDISTGEHDAHDRAFGHEYLGPNEDGVGVVLLFKGELNR